MRSTSGCMLAEQYSKQERVQLPLYTSVADACLTLFSVVCAYLLSSQAYLSQYLLARSKYPASEETCRAILQHTAAEVEEVDEEPTKPAAAMAAPVPAADSTAKATSGAPPTHKGAPQAVAAAPAAAKAGSAAA